jgi:CheY-like chemotaxis protein
LKLVDDLLDLNKVTRDKITLDLAIHDLASLLRSALETIAETADSKKVDVEFVDSLEPLRVEGDAGRLQQVFVNVLSNAVKFTPAGGRVLVTLEQSEDAAIVRVSDTGEGVEPKFLPYIFDIFRQQERGTRRRHPGLGIGLAVVKGLVDLHRGHVAIASAGRGTGTTVTISLPLTRELSAEPADAAERRKPFDHLTILLVEDTEDSLDATHVMLEVLGANVLVARDGIEALAVMAANRPDVVLCDLRMPRMDGYEFLRQLTRIQGRDHPPVVAMSGLASQADHQRTHAAGFEGHLDKPFDDTALVSSVRATLDHSRTA